MCQFNPVHQYSCEIVQFRVVCPFQCAKLSVLVQFAAVPCFWCSWTFSVLVLCMLYSSPTLSISPKCPTFIVVLMVFMSRWWSILEHFVGRRVSFPHPGLSIVFLVHLFRFRISGCLQSMASTVFVFSGTDSCHLESP